MRGSVRPITLIWAGFVSLVAGWMILFLMTARMIGASFIAAFGAYALTVVGFVVGLIGVFAHRRQSP